MEKTKLEKKEEQERTIKKKALFLEEFNKAFGMITIACVKAGIGRQTYYNWIDSDYVFKAQCESIDRIQVDYVDDKLLGLIVKGHAGAIMFYLGRRSNKYKEKLELSGEAALVAKYANVSDEELYKMLEAAKTKLDEAGGKINEAQDKIKEHDKKSDTTDSTGG